jgi:hypothetical protein
LILKDAPEEKSTPSACRTAFEAKLRRPEGSLRVEGDREERFETVVWWRGPKRREGEVCEN